MKSSELVMGKTYKLYAKYLGFRELVSYEGKTENKYGFIFKSLKSDYKYIYSLQEIHNLITEIDGNNAKIIF